MLSAGKSYATLGIAVKYNFHRKLTNIYNLITYSPTQGLSETQFLQQYTDPPILHL